MQMSQATYERRCGELRWQGEKAWLIRRLAEDGASYDQVAKEAGKSPETLRVYMHRVGEQVFLYDESRRLDAEDAALDAVAADIREAARLLKEMVDNRVTSPGGAPGGVSDGEQYPIHGRLLILKDYENVIRGRA